MKYIIIAVIVFVASGCCCDGKATFSRYDLINKSGYLINIKVYSRYNDSLQKTIKLWDTGDYWQSEEFKSSQLGDSSYLPGSPGSSSHFSTMIGGGSLIVTFDNMRSTILISPNYGNYSVFDFLNGVGLSESPLSKRYSVLTYIFTEKDFENASGVED